MTDDLLPTLSKVVLPAVGIALMLFAAQRNRWSLSNDLGFRLPKLVPSVLFFLLWFALIAIEEWLTSSMADTRPKSWAEYSAGIILLRVLAIGVLGPLAEEIAFRGLLLTFLSCTRIGIYGAVIISAALWSSVHFQYAPILLGIIFIDGIALGLARYLTKSIYIPIAMHIIGNLFSICQSLTY
jgi:membrane protease YdiL (CAAX protease family)